MANDKNNPVIMTVTAPTRDMCIDKIYSKYGSNYVLDGFTNLKKPGFLGIGEKDYVEQRFHLATPVTPKNAPGRDIYVPGNFENSVSYRSNPQINYGNSNVQNNSADFLKAQAELLHKMDPAQNVQMSAFNKKLDKIQSQLDDLAQNSSVAGEHKTIEKIEELMDENSFTRSYTKKIIDKVKKEFTFDELNDFDMVQSKVVDWIGESIKIEEHEYKRAPRVIIIVGPTGVGKTTTVAKMAADIALAAHNNPDVKVQPVIQMVSTDTMRVAAVDQLQKYGDIIHANVEQAENAQKLQAIYDSCASKMDYMFIDTSGFSPNDYENIAQMKRILDVKNMRESVYLAVLAGINAKDLENILRNYEAFNFKSVIVTKCDETFCFGGLLSVLAEKGKSISYVTTGQEVVNNIEKASPLFFLQKLTGFKLDLDYLERKFGKNTQE